MGRKHNWPNPRLPNSFFSEEDEVEELPTASALRSLSLIGGVIGMQTKHQAFQDLTRVGVVSEKKFNIEECKQMDSFVAPSDMLFTISRKIFLEETPGQPEVHKKVTSADSRNRKLVRMVDNEGVADTLVQPIEDGISDNQSPLFVKSDVVNSVVDLVALPNHPGAINGHLDTYRGPSNNMNNKTILRQNSFLRSLNNGNPIIGSNNPKFEIPEHGTPKLDPVIQEQNLFSYEEKDFVAVHENRKSTKMKGSAKELKKKRSIFSARLLDFRNMFHHEAKPIPNDNNLRGPVPIQVEDLRAGAWVEETKKQEVSSIKLNSDVALNNSLNLSTNIHELQMREINESSPDPHLSTENKSVSLTYDVLDVSRTTIDTRQMVNDINASYDSENTERSRWMDKLPTHLKKLPLNTLFIPGSHDSFSYSLEWGSRGPDVPQSIKVLSSILPCLAKNGFFRWSVTQRATLGEQLNNGIRYFDIRVAEKNKVFYFVHGLYGEKIETILNEISSFLLSHPGEVCLLDFQHLYNFSDDSHLRLQTLIKTVFKDRLCPYETVVDHISLSYMEEFKYQALVFYRTSPKYLEGEFSLWPTHSLPNPWPHTTSVKQMLDFIITKMQGRDVKKFFVTQSVMTPSSSYVLKNLSSSLEAKLCIPANRAMLAELPNFANRKGGSNVIMGDFVEFEDYALPRAIIKKNFDLVL